jgi:hypothetical protein
MPDQPGLRLDWVGLGLELALKKPLKKTLNH